MYPRSGFRSGGTSTKTILLENHPFARVHASGVVRQHSVLGRFWEGSGKGSGQRVLRSGLSMVFYDREGF